MLYGAGQYKYELVEGWAKIPEGWSFLDASGLDIDSEDRVYVINRAKNGDAAHPVMVFDKDGNLLNSWGEGLFKKPHGICVGPDGSIYCTDEGNHTALKFTPKGKLVFTMGIKDHPSDTGYIKEGGREERVATIKRGAPPFNRPAGIALSSSNEIYVSDGYGNARIHKFSSDGKLLESFGEPGTAPGQFRIPHGIWVDKNERIWVADRENSRIQIFDSKGRFLTQWNDVKRPQRAWIDVEGTVYVAEADQRMSIFSSNGKLLARWGNEGKDDITALFSAPHSLAVDSLGDLYVGEVAGSRLSIDRGSRSLQKFRRKR